MSAPRHEAADESQSIEDDYRITGIVELKQTVAKLQQRADELSSSGQFTEAAQTLNRVGRFQIRMYVADEATATFQQALNLLDRQPSIETRIDSLNGLASSYDNQNKCAFAKPHANHAIDLSTQNKYIAGKAEALLTLSHCQNHRDHALALKSAQEALGLWRSIDRKRGIAEAHVAIGDYQMGQNDLTESAKNLQTALSLYRELNDPFQQATILIYFGFLEYRKGAWQNTLRFYTEAQSLIDEKAEPYRMAQITGGLGEAFLESGLPEVALAKFREGLEYFRLAKAERGVRAMIWSIGRAQYMSGNYRDALESLQNARTDAASNNDRALTAFCDDFLGRTQYALSDYAAALSHFQSALDGYSKAGNKMEAARTRALMGQMFEVQGNPDQARKYYQDALHTFQSLSDHVNESATFFAIGKLELKADHLDLAEDYLRRSLEATENIRRISTSNDLTVAFSAAVHERYQSYIECLMRKHRAHPDQGFAERAFEINDQARARSLLEMLRATETNFTPGVDPILVEQEKTLRQSLRVKEDYRVTLLGRNYKREELVALESELRTLDANYKQVVEVLQNKYPAYKQIVSPERYDARQIQEKVIADDQTVLLEYSLGPDRSYVWAVTRKGLRSYELPAKALITEKAQKLYEMLSELPGPSGDDELIHAAKDLGHLILGPVAAELDKQTVLIVADGALHYIPFQLLPKSSADSQPLVATHEVVNAPSASILGGLQHSERKRQGGKLLAAFGAPVFSSNAAPKVTPGPDDPTAKNIWSNQRLNSASRDIQLSGDRFDPSVLKPLIHAARELSNLRNLMSADEVLVASDYDATRDKLLKTDLKQYSILHFATHGFFDPKLPENSGLVLSTVTSQGEPQNGFVGLQDIYQLNAPVDLVVMSACQTALGKDVRGEGLIGLTRGFMYAGASSVVASLWKVDDEATAELMKRFYTNMLQRGMTPAAALRSAQNSVREQPQWRSPYFWAAFTLQGDYHHNVKPASRPSLGSRSMFFSVGASAGLVAIALWWYFNRRARRKKRAE